MSTAANLTSDDVAARFACNRQTVQRLARELKVGVRLGNRWRFSEADVDAIHRHLSPVKAPAARRRTRRSGS